jgi:S1-C subfamily serine protease
VVLQVQRGTPAAAAGLQPGDIILKAGNQAVYTAKQLSAILKKSDMAKGLRLFVWRDGSTLYTFLQNGE